MYKTQKRLVAVKTTWINQHATSEHTTVLFCMYDSLSCSRCLCFQHETKFKNLLCWKHQTELITIPGFTPNSIYEICCNPQTSKQHLFHSQYQDASRHYTSFNNSYLLNHMHWADQLSTPFLLQYYSILITENVISYHTVKATFSHCDVQLRFTSSFHY